MDPAESSLDNKNSPPTDAPPVNSASQVFEISEDSIEPTSNDAPAVQEKRSTPPEEKELLDQKIGSFDAAPFAPPVTSPVAPPVAAPVVTPPVTPIITPVVPKQPAPVVPTMPNGQHARSLQDEISAALPVNLRPAQPGIPQTIQPERQTTQAVPVPITLQQNVHEHQNSPREVIKPVRTYEGDVAEAMSHKRASIASIAIAESKREQSTEQVADEVPSHTGRKIFMFIVSLILLGGGAFGAYYLYSKSALAPVTPVAQQQKAPPSIIPSTSQAVLTISPQNPTLIRKIILAEINKPQPPDSIKDIIIATKDQTGRLVRVSAADMIKDLDISTPDILSRSLTPVWMLGVYSNANGEKSVFVVGTTNFFQNTFAGMLQWEHVMADDLRMFLYPESVVGIADEGNETVRPPQSDSLNGIDSILPMTGTTTVTATSTKTTVASTTKNTSASSTAEIVSPLKQYLTIKGKFEDRIVKNKDVRAFRVDNGQIAFLYSFIDNNRIVVTDKESTLAELLNRLEKQAFIR